MATRSTTASRRRGPSLRPAPGRILADVPCLPTRELIDLPTLALWLGVSLPTVRGWVQGRLVPFKRIGPRMVRFKTADIHRWLAEREGIAAPTGPR